MYFHKLFFRFAIFNSLLLVFLSHQFLYSQNYWERTSGPGTVTVYDFVFKDNNIFIGTYHGGMYKSTDGGETWQHIENEFSSNSVYALELLSNGIILAGTGSGIHLSSDNGETWFYSALQDYLVSTISIDEAGFIYVGSYYGDDVFRSNDNGINWNPLNSGLTGVSSIVMKGINLILVSSANGITRSSDRGETWNRVFPPGKEITDVTLNINANFSAISYWGSFYLSTNDGITWDSISTLPYSRGRRIFCSANGDLYAGSYGVFRSTNEGQSWIQLNGFQGCGVVRSIAELGNSFYAGSYFSGVFRSTDYGTNWIQSSKGLNNSIVGYLVRDFTGRIISHGYYSSMAFTTDNGSNWSLLHPMGLLNSFSASPNGSLFASQGGGYSGVILRSTDSGYNWETIFGPGFDTSVTQVNVNVDASVYAIIKGKLHKSLNNGDEWELIQIISENEWINRIDLNSVGIIFVKSSEGYFRSSDNGESWEQLTSIPEGLNIFGINKSDDIYATASDSSYYRSTDYGDSWEFVFKGSGKTMKAFASNDIGYLFISVLSVGVFRSTDNGFSWQEINDGLDSSSVNALIITDDDYLLAGTSWKGVYRSIKKTTSIENNFTNIPNTFQLDQNYPNPFNPTTNIRYSVRGRQFVSLKVYDVLGNQVATLVDEEKSPGIYAVEFNAENLSSGIYFYHLKAGTFSESRKMILLK